MNINQVFCTNCSGTGYMQGWRMVDTDETGVGTIQTTESVCKACRGKGWIEYPVFSVEEAKAILKHCGLSTES